MQSVTPYSHPSFQKNLDFVPSYPEQDRILSNIRIPSSWWTTSTSTVSVMPGSGTGGRRGGGEGVGDGMEELFRSKMAARDPEFAIDKIVHQNLSYKIHPPATKGHTLMY